MAVQIGAVEPRSYAKRLGLKAGDKLISINGHPVEDVLDYRFYLTECQIELEAEVGGLRKVFSFKKGEYEDIGINFDSYLIDKERRCRNNCVFCFIDQNPPGMRESIYFKDDDERLSFLFGNYITLTNLTEREVGRIAQMRISPVNLSLHTMNPDLRVRMMKNKRAGEVLGFIDRFHSAGIKMNIQLVLVHGQNDGEELCYSLQRISEYRESISSVACVPVGLTAYRRGLAALEPFCKQSAAEVIDIIEGFDYGDGGQFCYPSDEFFLLAQRPIPSSGYYGDFAQLQNGVGMSALFEEEFSLALDCCDPPAAPRNLTVVTGEAAAPLISRLADRVQQAFPGISVGVMPVKNRFFGGGVTVAGLVTGSDILLAMKDRDPGDALLFPDTMLRAEGDLFLDGLTPGQIQEALGVPVLPCPVDGGMLLDALLGHSQY